MCGIVALVSREVPVSPEILARATAALEHRGPDGQRQWIGASGKVGLGHARLSIIDLTTGDQPLANEDGTVHVVVNGELYDFERIRAELERRGHVFRTRSDSEIVLHLYEEYGAHCVHHLRGEFAFVLWDDRQRRLLAVRDRFGIKPLFYADLPGRTLGFASEVKALVAAGLQPRWDEDAFAQAVFAGGLGPDRTLFAGVRQVPAGHYLLVDGDTRRLLRYWDFDYPLQPAAGDDQEQVARFGAALDEAVRLRLRADVPVGCYLSGGLDSCAILGLAARHAPKPIRAFTLSFEEPAYDEEAIAGEMASRANAEYVPIKISQRDLAEDFSDAVYHTEQPFPNGHGVAKYRLSRAVREQGYRVVLTGEGSDEILAGYPHFRRDMLLYDHGGQDPAVIARLLGELEAGNAISRGLLMPAGPTLAVSSVERLLGFVPSWIQTNAANGQRARALLSPELLALAEGRDYFRDLLDTLDVPGQLQGRAPVHQSLYLWSKTALPNYILSVLGDRMEMAHSVEGRVPFLDHHVVETARALPVTAKIRGTTEKYVLREAVRDLIPPAVYRRQKHPFLAPPAAAAPEGALHALLQATLRGPALQRVPFYDQKKVVALLDALPAVPPEERSTIDLGLMALLSVAVLAERFQMS